MACNESVACNEGKRRGGEGERQGSLSSHTLAVVRKAKATACEVRVRQEGRARACKGRASARARNEFGRQATRFAVIARPCRRPQGEGDGVGGRGWAGAARARACKGRVRARVRANEFGRSSDEARRHPLRQR